jgi:predicted  nucleic acid-binding Zn-ribbon protein
MAEIDALARLQQLDSQVDERQHRIEAIRAALRGNAELNAAQVAHDAAKSRLAGLEKRGRDLEWDVGDRSNRITELDKKLYGGTVTNPKELAGLQTEIEHLRTALAEVEEKALGALSQVEEARDESAARERALSGLQARWKSEERALKTEGQGLVASLQELKGRRPQLSAAVSPVSLARYEDLRKRLNGLAVARVDRNICLGCRTSVPTAQVQMARQGQLAHCPSCGRFLTVT